MSADLSKSREVDLQQHRNDHQPDEYRHRQIHPSQLHAAEGLEGTREEITEPDAGADAKNDPKTQVAFEETERCLFERKLGRVRLLRHGRFSFVLRAAALPIRSSSF